MKFFDRSILAAILTGLCLAGAVRAQSINQDFPTPVTSSEISGTIKPRDIGDARLTSYYYQFDGGQGDLFINIVTRNFTGDIDIFTQSGLRPLAKIVVYADLAESETGRVLYLRKPEKMILRVQGRTPGDEAAMFRIKFAGSFVASTQAEPAPEPALPTFTARNESGIRVNSVGTIVAVTPKPTPAPPEVDTTSRTDERRSVPADTETPVPVTEVKTDEKTADPAVEDTPKKVGVVVTENIPPATTRPAGRRTGRRGTPPRAIQPDKTETATTPPETPAKAPPPRTRRGRAAAPPKVTAVTEPDPLEKVNLVILFKDGTTIQRPMTEVLRFTVDKGLLTVISKDGSIGRYSILDVARVTIE